MPQAEKIPTEIVKKITPGAAVLKDKPTAPRVEAVASNSESSIEKKAWYYWALGGTLLFFVVRAIMSIFWKPKPIVQPQRSSFQPFSFNPENMERSLKVEAMTRRVEDERKRATESNKLRMEAMKSVSEPPKIEPTRTVVRPPQTKAKETMKLSEVVKLKSSKTVAKPPMGNVYKMPQPTAPRSKFG